MNAAQAIEERALIQGWTTLSQGQDHTPSGYSVKVVFYLRGNHILRVYYRLFGGSGGARMCRWYGVDASDRHYVNWGVEHAEVVRVSIYEASTTIVQSFTGPKKKAQVLAWLKDHDPQLNL